MATKEKLKLITQKGTAVYPRLQTPDFKYDKAGVFSTGLRLDQSDPAVQAWMATIEEIVDAEFAAAKRTAKKGTTVNKVLPWKIEKDEEDVPTGFIVARFKMKSRYIKDKELVEQTPTIIDSRKGPFRGGTIGGGSELKIKHPVVEYTMTDDKTGEVNCGATLYLNVVQVIKFVEYVGNLDGFESEEGYSAESFDSTDDETTAPEADFQ